MLALVLAMLFCVAIGAGVVGYVLLEARREGRGGFWTAEGEELIAGARRTSERVRARGGELVGTAAARTGIPVGAAAARDRAPLGGRRGSGTDQPQGGDRVLRDRVYEEPAEDAADLRRAG